MFRWLTGRGDGLEEVETVFTRMLADDRRVFDLAMTARVGGADPEVLSDDLFATEEQTDEAERTIRRLVLVHASVAGTADIPACLMYMSIAKDAERVADLSKNLFGIARTVGPPPAPLLDEFVVLKDRISPMITEAADIFTAEDTAAAEDFIERARDLQAGCRDRIDELLQERTDLPQAAASVLSFRHLSRIVANLLNIVSAVVMPLDRLDYPTDDEDDR